MRSPAPRLARASMLCLALVTGRSALAEGVDPDAETLFRQGRAAAVSGDFVHACAAFAESQRLEPAPGTLLNLADCEDHLGRVASAWRDFGRAEAAFAEGDERRGVSHDRAATLASRVPWVTVTLGPGVPPDARVFWDDSELDGAHLATAMPVDPGTHSMLVVAAGRESRTTTVRATESETVRVFAAPGPPLREAPAPSPRPSHLGAWLVGGAGVVALGVGTIFGARALSERSASDAACSGTLCSNASSLDAYASARSDARIADVALGVGVVGLVVSGVLLLTSGKGAPSTSGAWLHGAGTAGTW